MEELKPHLWPRKWLRKKGYDIAAISRDGRRWPIVKRDIESLYSISRTYNCLH
jgi:hypothetical protein